MTAGITFASFVAVEQRSCLEGLVFFNARQERVLTGIIDAIEKFGPPEIVEESGRLRVRVAGTLEAQSLFAIDSDTGRPVGVAVYLRSDLESMTVLHIGIAEEFTSAGARAPEHLLSRLLGELRRNSRRLKGVRRMEVIYRSGRAANRGHSTGRKLLA